MGWNLIELHSADQTQIFQFPECSGEHRVGDRWNGLSQFTKLHGLILAEFKQHPYIPFALEKAGIP